jgi:hypothetical protein
MTMVYHCNHGIDSQIVRIFNTHSLPMRLDDGHTLRAGSIMVYGDGA